MPRDGAWWLDEFHGKKIRIQCDHCGLSRQYDGTALYGRLGEMALPDVRLMLAKALGCDKTENEQRDICQMRFLDVEG